MVRGASLNTLQAMALQRLEEEVVVVEAREAREEQRRVGDLMVYAGFTCVASARMRRDAAFLTRHRRLLLLLLSNADSSHRACASMVPDVPFRMT